VRSAIVTLVLMLGSTCLACSRPADPPSIKGPAGAGHRVVCLTPSTTEVVRAVGGIQMVVGVDQYSTNLVDVPEVHSLPQVGSFLAPSLEAILALHPDIVLLDAVQSRVVEGLNNSGIRFFALPMQTVSDVRAALISVGDALGVPEAGRAAAARLDADLEAAAATAGEAAKKAGRRPRVLFVVDRRAGGLAGMIAAGPGTYIDELLGRAGVENVLHDAPVRYVQIAAEEVVARAPDVILDAMHDGDPEHAKADWAPLASVPAVRDGKVVLLSDPMFVTPGPRLGEALRRLVAILWA
jgi:iron complex transport system substrate-binding protein